jgi:hypothetical protein
MDGTTKLIVAKARMMELQREAAQGRLIAGRRSRRPGPLPTFVLRTLLGRPAAG